MDTAQPALVPDTPDEAAVTASEHSPAEERTAERLWRYSTWLHVGEGAAECEHAEDGKCDDRTHFHAWCRLPNQFQHESIREKALAAKARRIRILKDPESDARTIIDFALEELRETGDTEAMIEEIISKDRLKVHFSAVEEVKGQDEYAHIDEDRDRLRALEGMTEDERSEEELNHLRAHVEAFDNLVREKKEEIFEPEREGLRANSVDELIEFLRQDRIERDGAREFMSVFSRWHWYMGTLKGVTPEKAAAFPTERYFASITQMEGSADAVLNALDETFADLEAELAAQGKDF